LWLVDRYAHIQDKSTLSEEKLGEMAEVVGDEGKAQEVRPLVSVASCDMHVTMLIACPGMLPHLA
jgi:hypothetical protein